MEIVPGNRCTVAQRTLLAHTLIREFGTHYPDWTVDQAADELAAHGPLPMSLIALDGDIALGCASLLDDDEVTGWVDRIWLGNVVVLGTERGRGIGAALVDAIERYAASMGFPELHLVTSTAIDWYERRGWTALGVADVHGHAMTVMRRAL